MFIQTFVLLFLNHLQWRCCNHRAFCEEMVRGHEKYEDTISSSSKHPVAILDAQTTLFY